MFFEAYQKAKEISDKFASKNKDYKTRSRQVLFAAAAFNSTKRVLYLQMPTGTGKTFTNLIFAKLCQEHKSMNVMYCSKNEALLENVKTKAKSIGVDLEYCLPADLNTNLSIADDDWQFIVDEYYDILRDTKLNVDTLDKIPGIFTIGTEHNMLLTTAHYSKLFKEGFLLKRFDDVDVSFCYEDIFPHKQENNMD